MVTVGMWQGRTRGQHAELARAITDGVVNIAKTSPGATTVLSHDISRDDRAEAGVPPWYQKQAEHVGFVDSEGTS